MNYKGSLNLMYYTPGNQISNFELIIIHGSIQTLVVKF